MRERSAGGVVVTDASGVAVFAAIRPAGRPEGVWALPKGNVDAGEEPEAAALREVREETGLTCRVLGPLEPVRYFYVREGVRVAKVVELWLMVPVSGSIDDIEPEMRLEVAEARWLPLAEADRLLAFRSERERVSAVAARLAEEGG